MTTATLTIVVIGILIVGAIAWTPSAASETSTAVAPAGRIPGAPE
jgi:hypothetical protein